MPGGWTLDDMDPDIIWLKGGPKKISPVVLFVHGWQLPEWPRSLTIGMRYWDKHHPQSDVIETLIRYAFTSSRNVEGRQESLYTHVATMPHRVTSDFEDGTNHWKLINEPRNKHYRDTDRESYERTSQRCWYVCGPKHGSDFVADIITANNAEGYINARLMAAAPDMFRMLLELRSTGSIRQMKKQIDELKERVGFSASHT